MEKTYYIEKTIKAMELTNQEKIKIARGLLYRVALETDDFRMNDIAKWLEVSREK